MRIAQLRKLYEEATTPRQEKSTGTRNLPSASVLPSRTEFYQRGLRNDPPWSFREATPRVRGVSKQFPDLAGSRDRVLVGRDLRLGSSSSSEALLQRASSVMGSSMGLLDRPWASSSTASTWDLSAPGFGKPVLHRPRSGNGLELMLTRRNSANMRPSTARSDYSLHESPYGFVQSIGGGRKSEEVAFGGPRLTFEMGHFRGRATW